ncbi:MAG TPA: DMT family transporter [Solirubrobacteraceae bacterium]|nr:DMT family transporter [Solirubrobacteraceae bacterium]
MIPVALALGASIAWGCSDFLAGLKARKLALLWVLLVSQGTGLVLVLVAALASGAALPSGNAALLAAGAGVAELIGFAAFYRALAVGSMSIVAPVSATAAIVPILVGVAAGDVPMPIQAVGMALALAGAAIASLEPGRADGKRRAAAGVGLALVAALGFGGFFVGMDLAADEGALWAVTINRFAAVGVVVALVLATRRPCPLDRGTFPSLVAVGALDVAANTMFAVALTLGMAAVVSVLGSLYPLATVILARAILHEHVTVSQRTGVLAALAGVGLVSLA